MIISDFDYHLPESAIAQHPLPQRDLSRVLLVDRKTGKIEDRKFLDLPQILNPQDLLVVNNTRVIPARLFAQRKTGAKIEITLLGRTGAGIWEGLLKGKKPKPNEQVEIGQGVSAVFLEEEDLDANAGWTGGLWKIRLSDDSEKTLEKLGVPPLPPYIKRGGPEEYEPDRSRYQTIFAKEPGAVAAPTAGLHFTERVVQKLQERGIGMAEITLEVGYGTFAPVRVEKIEDHRMHSEKYFLSEASAEKIVRARKNGGRIVAVGTTSARTLEAGSNEKGEMSAGEGETSLFIYPGYQFKAVDALLTNFHLPRSTLLMLVSAFAGTDLIRKAYAHALENGYRFLSYGDAMLIV